MLALAVIPLALLWIACAVSIVGLALSREPEPGPSIEQLIRQGDGLEGWTLVERAEQWVHAAMPGLGHFNGFDTPRLALERRCGSSWQRALVLRSVLRAHRFEARAVHDFHHVWVEVTFGGEVRAVCRGGGPLETSRRLHSFGPGTMLLTWLGAPIADAFGVMLKLARRVPVLPSAGTPLTWRARVSRSALWLVVPILAWNAALASRLPAGFLDDRAVPGAVLVGEALGRLFVMGAPLVLLFGARDSWQRRGLVLFAAGTVAYFLSWLPLLQQPAPSWTWLLPYLLPGAWLAGLALTTRSGAYLVGGALFALSHGAHGLIVVRSLTAGD